jgi:hypothetical protein
MDKAQQTLNKEAKLLSDTLAEHGIQTTRGAAEWLNEKMPKEHQMSHTSIWDYARGAKRINQGYIRSLQLFYETEDERHILGNKLDALRYGSQVIPNKEKVTAYDALDGKKLLEKVKVKRTQPAGEKVTPQGSYKA